MPGRSGQGLAGGFEVFGVADVDVGDLVVGDGEGAGGHRVEVLHAVLGVDLEQSGAAQGAVDVDGAGDGGDAVLGQRDDGAAFAAGVGRAAGPGRRRGRRRPGGSGGRGGRSAAGRSRGGGGSQGQVGVAGGMMCRVASMIHWEETRSAPGPQKWKRGKVPRCVGEFVVQGGRPGVAVGFLAAVGVVDGAGGDGAVGVGAHGVPPADVGDGVAGVAAAGGVPELVAADQAVVLAPQEYVAEFAEVPAVADDAVFGGQGAGQEGGLGGAGDGGQHGAEGGLGAGVGRGPRGAGMWARSWGVRPTTSRTSRGVGSRRSGSVMAVP